LPEGNEKVEAAERQLDAVLLHTNSEGHSALKCQLNVLQDDFESLKALLIETSFQIGKFLNS